MRTLFVDETLGHALAGALRARGRPAVSWLEWGLSGATDGEVLDAVRSRDPGAVIVTADDLLPAEHADALRRSGATVATVEPQRGSWRSVTPDLNAEEAEKRELVHRWAHAMGAQRSGTWRRYTTSGHRPWTPRGAAG